MTRTCRSPMCSASSRKRGISQIWARSWLQAMVNVRLTLPLFERGEHIAHVPESGPYRVRQALSRRGQLEPVSVAHEKAEAGFALYGGDVTTDRRSGDAELGARRGEILMPGGDFEHDERIDRGQRPPQSHHIKIITNP